MVDGKIIDQNMGISDIAAIHYQWVEDNGYGNENAQGVLTLMQKAALVSIDLQGGDHTNILGRRLASVILWAMDIAVHNGIDIDYQIRSKVISNHSG